MTYGMSRAKKKVGKMEDHLGEWVIVPQRNQVPGNGR